jgi:hypothetical protein
LRTCEDSKSREEALSAIMKHARSHADVFLKPYGADPPQNCPEEYANQFITGYQIVVRFSNPPTA